MKTKILSKIMMIAVMSVIIGWKGNNEKDEIKDTIQTANDQQKNTSDEQPFDDSDCKVCNNNDTYEILQKDAIKLITAFHNIVLTSTSKINNIGGYFTLDPPPSNAKDLNKKNLLSYTTFKFHWAIEDTTINSSILQRLFITYEPSNYKCNDNNEYEGTDGIQDTKLYSSYPENDILPIVNRGANLTEQITQNFLTDLQVRVNANRLHRREVSDVNARDYLTAFQNHNDVKTFYKCKDIVFDKSKTLYPIAIKSGKESFIYFFGFDSSQIHHRLRLIIAGFDKNNKIIFLDGTKTLLRENSRPRP